jgi:hypothetical protein
MTIEIDTHDKVQRYQIGERILRLYEAAELSTRRSYELLERLYEGPRFQEWNWPNVYATSDIDKKK